MGKNSENKIEEEKIVEKESDTQDPHQKLNGDINTKLQTNDLAVKNDEEICNKDGHWNKKLSGDFSFEDIFLNDFIFEEFLEFFSFEEIFRYIYPLNKKFRKLVNESNYMLFQKMADCFNITSGYLTSDLPASENILEVYKQAIFETSEGKEIDMKPQGFYTDSGLVGTNMWYSFHNIFDTNTSNMYGGYVFSSGKGKNNHVQFYLGVPAWGVDNPFCQKMKKEYELPNGDGKEIYVPYQKPSDGSVDTFKLPKTFEMNFKNQGFSFYADNIVLCFSASEVDNKKFQQSTKFFNDFKWATDVEESGIPILNKDTTTKGFTVFEFDLSQKDKMLEVMDIKKFVSIPLCKWPFLYLRNLIFINSIIFVDNLVHWFGNKKRRF